jgi:hypothetical protein
MRTPTMREQALRGRWLAAAGRRLLSAESFEHLVEPAIADLQREDSGRLADCLAAYATVWVGMLAACDQGLAQRARTLVRENELVTLTVLILLHTAHSAWMVVLLLGLDGRVHLKNVIASTLAAVPGPAVLTASAVIALYLLRVVVSRATRGPVAAHLSITVGTAE